MHDAGPQTDAGFRPLSEQERAVILALLNPSFVGRDELLTQLTTARASIGCDCGCPTIALAADKTLSSAPVRGYVAAEAAADIDGEPIQILLFARDGYMSGLELVWYGDEPPRRWPATEAIKVMDYEKPTWSDGT
jgi:hypothetical protein